MMYAHNSGLPGDDIPRIQIARIHLNDWRSSYFGTTCEEEGFAWRLTCMIYDSMGELPDDDERNARAMCLDIRVYRRLRHRLIVEMGKFAIAPGRITHARIVREIEDYITTRRRRSEAATERERDRKLQVRSAGLPANLQGEVQQKSAGSPADVQPKLDGLLLELEADLLEKPNEINGCTATMVGTPEAQSIRPPRARACPKPKPIREEKYIPGAPPPPSPVGELCEPASAKGKPKVTRAEAVAAFDAYNALARRIGLMVAQRLTSERERHIRNRLADYGLEGWTRALANIERSKYLRGGNKDGWKADLDFMVRPSRFPKLHDGGYGNGAHAGPAQNDPAEIEARRAYEAELEIARQRYGGVG